MAGLVQHSTGAPEPRGPGCPPATAHGQGGLEATDIYLNLLGLVYGSYGSFYGFDLVCLPPACIKVEDGGHVLTTGNIVSSDEWCFFDSDY